MDGIRHDPHLLGRRRSTAWAVVLAAVLSSLLVIGVLTAPLGAFAAVATTVGLGTARNYSVLAGSAVTNTGPTVLSDNVGVSPLKAISGFPPGIVGGTRHAGDAAAGQAQSDLTTAYNDAAGRASNGAITADLGGPTYLPGVYKASSSAKLTGTLTLNGQDDPNSVFIFQIGSTLTTATNSSVSLINGAQACNVFFQVGSSATVGVGTRFVGTILALTSITVKTGATVDGRALARNGAVTLDDNVFTSSACRKGTPSVSTTPSASDTPTRSGSPSASDTPTGSKTPTKSGSPSGSDTPTASDTATASDTPSASRTVTASPTTTGTQLETDTPSATRSATRSQSATHSQSATRSATATRSQSAIASQVATQTQLETESAQATASETSVAQASSTASGGTLADTGTSRLTSILGVAGALLVLLGAGVLLAARLRSGPKRRH